MNGDEIIDLLGKCSDDKDVQLLFAAFKIKKAPKLPRGEMDAFVENLKMGIEITFRDERYLDVTSEEYDDGALVLWNVRMYGKDDNFKRFPGELPIGLRFEQGLKESIKRIGKKPNWQNKEMGKARWDLKSFCLFLAFDDDYQTIMNASVQLPLK